MNNLNTIIDVIKAKISNLLKKFRKNKKAPTIIINVESSKDTKVNIYINR